MISSELIDFCSPFIKSFKLNISDSISFEPIIMAYGIERLSAYFNCFAILAALGYISEEMP